MLEPTELSTVTKEKIIEEWEVVDRVKKEIEVYISALRDELFERIKGNGEVIKNYTVTKVEKLSFKKFPIETARELGFVKEVLDEARIKKAYQSGAKLPIPPEISRYLLIRPIEKND